MAFGAGSTNTIVSRPAVVEVVQMLRDTATVRSSTTRALRRLGVSESGTEPVVRDARVVGREVADDADASRVGRLDQAEVGVVSADEWVDGVEPDATRLASDFVQLGAITARLHTHARTWSRPAGFTRFVWDYDTSIGDRGWWGRWQDGLGMGAEELAVLGRLDDALRRRLAAYGTGPERFGLVHADMRLANLLVSGEQVNVIDFDDCGFSWYMYDLASSVSFIEHEPYIPELIDAWVRGYRTVAELSADDEAELPTFVMLRRLLLVAWIGSHAATQTAQEMGPEYTTMSCHLAEQYLSEHA